MSLAHLDFHLPRTFGEYTLLRRLSVGGTAEVYVAKVADRTQHQRLVALKVIHPRYSENTHFTRMLAAEARLSVLLDHPNIGQVFDLIQKDGAYCLVIEYIDGVDAFRFSRRVFEYKIALPIEFGCYVVSKLCRALAYAHAKLDDAGQPLHIVHRDVSPHNLMLSYDGDIKLIDFGVAKTALREVSTAAGVVKGKYGYMSPEQALGDPLDARSDIFSAGAILYELVSGAYVYPPSELMAMFDMVKVANITPVGTHRASLPEPLQKIVHKALEKKPEDRFQTATEMADALDAFVAELSSAGVGSTSVSEWVSKLFALERDREYQELVEAEKKALEFTEPGGAPQDSVLASNSREAIFLRKEQFQVHSDTSILARPSLLDEDLTRSHPPPLVQGESVPPTQHDIPAVAAKIEPTTWRPPALGAKRSSLRESLMASNKDKVEDSAQATLLDKPSPPAGMRRPLFMPSEGATTQPKVRPSMGPPSITRPIGHGAHEPVTDPAQASPVPSIEGQKTIPPLTQRDENAAPVMHQRAPSSQALQAVGGVAPAAMPGAPQRIPSLSPLDAASPNAFPHELPPGAWEAQAYPMQAGGWFRLWRWVIGGAVVLVALGAFVAFLVGRKDAATLDVITVPPGATVILDGVMLNDTTPLQNIEVSQNSDQHRLDISLRGYASRTVYVNVREGHVQHVEVLKPQRAVLRVSTMPQGAHIWVDGVLYGQAPLNVPNLAIGQQIEIQATLSGKNKVVQRYVVSGQDLRPQIMITLPLENKKRMP